MGVHRLWFEGSRAKRGDLVRLTGDEAKHAVRVKRVATGDRVELLGGSGFVASGVVESASAPGSGGMWLNIRVEAAGVVEPASPRVEVCSATPKGQRVAELVEQLSQVGAAVWRPLITERGVVDPGDTKLDRLERVAIESAKQCGRAWPMSIGEPITLEAALAAKGAGGTRGVGDLVVVADAQGGRYGAVPGVTNVRILIGPEGGWSDAERTAIAGAPGVAMASFGPHVMRIETAAVAAAAIILDAAR